MAANRLDSDAVRSTSDSGTIDSALPDRASELREALIGVAIAGREGAGALAGSYPPARASARTVRLGASSKEPAGRCCGTPRRFGTKQTIFVNSQKRHPDHITRSSE